MLLFGSYTSEAFFADSGVSQGNALSCLLFNLALEKVVHNSKVQTTATIFFRLVLVLGYADDIDIVPRYERALKLAFMTFETAGKELGLVNEQKTKYMRASGGAQDFESLKLGPYKFDKEDSLIYLGTEVNSQNNVSQEKSKQMNISNR